MTLWFYELCWLICRPFYHLGSFICILKASYRCGVRRAEERVLDEYDFLAVDLDPEADDEA